MSSALTTHFAATYVINLPERVDRRAAVAAELERAGMPFEQGRVELFPALRTTHPAGFPSSGARGCFLSHRSVLETAIARGLPNVLIMEDDLRIAPALPSAGQFLVADLAAEPWDVAFFGHVERLQVFGGGPRLVSIAPEQGIMTAHFYGVNGPAMPRLLRYLREVEARPPGHPMGGPMHYDGALSMFRRFNRDLRTRIAAPSMGSQRASRSDISAGLFDRIPGVRSVVSALRARRAV